MDDILAAIGLVFVIEGLLWALLPGLGYRALEAVQDMPERSLRLAGVVAAVIGVFIVWLVRG